MWRKEYRIVYYSWEFDTLQSFYRDLLRLPQMYGWYTSPVDRGLQVQDRRQPSGADLPPSHAAPGPRRHAAGG